MSTDIGNEDVSVLGVAEQAQSGEPAQFELDPENNQIVSLIPQFQDLTDDVPVEVYDEDEAAVAAIAEAVPPTPIGRTWLFDFNQGEFDTSSGSPRKLQDNDALILQQWIRRALTTERGTLAIYPPNFGVELEGVWSGELTGTAAVVKISDTMRQALTYHDRIVDVQNIVMTEESGTMFVRANVVIDNGDVLPVNVPLGEV